MAKYKVSVIVGAEPAPTRGLGKLYQAIVDADNVADAVVAFNKAMIKKYGSDEFKRLFCSPDTHTWTAAEPVK
jgi:hypothetical protein